MAKTDADKRADLALRALLAPREDSIRGLAQALDNIETIDTKISALLDERDQAISAAGAALDEAKVAGWKPRELVNAGLILPRPITVPGLSKTPAPVTTTNDQATDEDTSGGSDSSPEKG